MEDSVLVDHQHAPTIEILQNVNMYLALSTQANGYGFNKLMLLANFSQVLLVVITLLQWKMN